MDESTLDRIADVICGDDRERFPVYRTSTGLTQFFYRAGLSRFVHDGSTRKWWVLEALRQCNGAEKALVLKRLASPAEYGGDPALVRKAVTQLNAILRVESLRIVLEGTVPKIARVKAPLIFDTEQELKPLPPPDFGSLGLSPELGSLLALRWDESQRCIDARAYLAAIIVMGSLLEGMLLGAFQRRPRLPNQASNSPKDPKTGRAKPFSEWTLAQMIDVAHAVGWLGLDVRKFSHALREFRNLVHPHEQARSGASPDEDTCKISWLVVQAATNDLARILRAFEP